MAVREPGSESPLRIVQVSTSDVGGGAEAVASGLHDAYLDRGHDAWLVVGHRRGTGNRVLELEDEHSRKAPARATIRASRLLDPWAEMSITGRRVRNLVAHLGQPRRRIDMERGVEDFDFPGTWGLLELPAGRPDVLQLHNLHGGYFDLRALPVFAAQVPTVLTLHDTWLLTGHCAYFIDCEGWLAGCGSCPDLERYPAVKRDATDRNWERKRAIYSESRVRVATPSRWLARQVERSTLVDAVTELRVIPYGIDVEVFRTGDRSDARGQLGLPEDADVVVFVAHQFDRSSYKDPSTVLAAAERIIGQRRTRTIAVCIGSHRPTRTLSGGSEIRFVGEIRDQGLIADWLRAADLALHAAHADNLPLTVLEASACGTPVVATAVGGVPEEIRGWDGLNRLGAENVWDVSDATGVLVRPSDHAAMAEAVIELLDDRDTLAALSRNAAEHVAIAFHRDREVDEYLGWFSELVRNQEPAVR